MGNLISQILMLYFWLRIYLKAFSIACHGCRVKVFESLPSYVAQWDFFWPASRCIFVLCSQPASLSWCLQEELGREDTKATNMERWKKNVELVGDHFPSPLIGHELQCSFLPEMFTPLSRLEPAKLLFLLLLSYLITLFCNLFCLPQA